MQTRGLLIATVLLAALVGGYFYSEKLEKEKAGKPAKDAPPKILEVPEEQMTQVEIKKKDAETTVLKRGTDGKWTITAPKPLGADQDAVKGLASTLGALASDKVVEEKAVDLAAYGLNTPSMEIAVTKKDGKTQKVLLGDETPTGGGSFVRLDGDPRVFTIASFNKTGLDKSWKDLRDKRLLTFDSDKLTRVELQAKGGTVELGKNNKNEWAILKPKPYRADNFACEEIVRKLKDAKMDTSLSDDELKKSAAAYAGAPRVALASVTDSGGSQTIEIHKDKDKNYYAKSSAVEGIYKVTAEIGDGLDKGIDDLRNKKLFDFGFNEPSKVEVNQNGKVSKFEKSGDKWQSGGKTMDSVGVQSVIDKLRDLASIKFLEAGGGTPVADIAVTSQDGKSVEKVAITKQGDKYFGRRENEPAVYELDAKVVDELQKAVADVKEAQPPKPDAKDAKKEKK